MDLKELDIYLRKENEIEKRQKLTGENITEDEIKETLNLGNEFLIDEFRDFVMSKKLFFKKANIYISKHNRYSKMISHAHEFIEINYMYSGECVQIINGKKIVLKEGDICLLDKNIKHEIEALDENDILINILIRSEDINTEILQKMAISKSILTEFLLYASQEWNSHNQYLVLQSRDNKKIQEIVKSILVEYYDESIYSMEVIKLTLPLLFIELVRSYNEDTYWYREDGSFVIIDALKKIEEQFDTITLSDLAKQMGFNKNYLGNLLKKETGETFSKLLLKQRLLNAYNLVVNTNYSMEDITHKLGLSSVSYFFKIFKEHFNESPGEVREKINCI